MGALGRGAGRGRVRTVLVLVLARGGVQRYLARDFEVEGQLGRLVNLMARAVIIDVRVGRLVLVGRDASESRGLDVVEILRKHMAVRQEARDKASGTLSWQGAKVVYVPAATAMVAVASLVTVGLATLETGRSGGSDWGY